MSLLQRLEDVRVGDKVLVVGDPPTIAPMALLLSQAGQSLVLCPLTASQSSVLMSLSNELVSFKKVN